MVNMGNSIEIAWGSGLHLVALALWVRLGPPVPGRRHPLAEETWHEAPAASGSNPVGSTPSVPTREDRRSREFHDSRQPLISKCSSKGTL